MPKTTKAAPTRRTSTKSDASLERVCPVDGTTFTATRSTAVYCSATCRQRRKRSRGPAKISSADVAQVLDDASPAADNDGNGDPWVGDVEIRTRLELERLRKVETVIGAQALTLAKRLDRWPMDTGSAVAAVSRELTRLLKLAEAGNAAGEDEVEKARRRRAEKLANARASSS